MKLNMKLYVLYTSLLYLLNLVVQCAGDTATGDFRNYLIS